MMAPPGPLARLAIPVRTAPMAPPEGMESMERRELTVRRVPMAPLEKTGWQALTDSMAGMA